MSDPLLHAEGLTKHYSTAEGFLDRLLGRGRRVRAVDGVDLDVREGETLALVGESGCGKSTLGRTLLCLEDPTAGSVYFRGEDLTELDGRDLRARRRDLQMTFQHPLSSLDPRTTVADAVGEAFAIHDVASGRERARRVEELLSRVGLGSDFGERYPHELSGGQRQRIALARALAVDPALVVCDEPTSALDVSVQAQVLDLLADLQAERGLSYLFVTHDLSVASHVADRIAVMYLGELVEVGTRDRVLSPPFHPYTKALLSAVPEPDPRWRGERIPLDGPVPSAADPPSGCKFHTRCPVAQSDCAEWDDHPDLVAVDDGEHRIACPYHELIEEVP